MKFHKILHIINEGDDRRFQVFADFIEKKFPVSRYKKIADVAGGKGYLQVALREKGYDVTTFDKRANKANFSNLKYQYRYFSDSIQEHFDLIVGMHPDEATDIIITQAIKRYIPFAVVPCCVKPFSVLLKNQYNYTNWMEHLKSIAEKANYNVEEYRLKISGKNIVLIGKP